jgi:hypothetical protein
MRTNNINPTTYGSISWRSIQSVDEDSEAAFDIWKEVSYERFLRQCTIVREIIWIATEVREPPTYNATLEVHNFLTGMEEKITEEQRIFFLDLALQDTPARWWTTHKASIIEWEDTKQDIRCLFQGRDWLKNEMNIDFQDV